MAYKSSLRGARPVSLVTVHTAEGARTARSLAAYFWRDDIRASSHDGIDASETLHMVPYDRAAWTLRAGNPISDNVELCAFARWTREQWLSTDTVDGCANPRAILHRAAEWIRQRCEARGIDKRKLTVVEVGRGHWGVIGHVDWTLGSRALLGYQDGTHTDPGGNFPWDYVMNLVADGEQQEEDDMTPEEHNALIYVRDQLQLVGQRTTAGGQHKVVGDVWTDTYIWTRMIPALAATVSQIAAAVAEGDLDPDMLAGRLDTAVREATTTAVVDTILPEIQRIRQALEQDDASEAKAIVTELAERLRPAA